MFCLKCGKAIPDGSEICPICGENLKKSSEEQAIVYASQTSAEISAQTVTKSKRKTIKVIIVIFILLGCILGIIFGILQHQKVQLKKDLMREWKALDGSIILVLDIDEDKIEYRAETGYSWMDTTFSKYDWKVKNRNTIEIKRFGDEYEEFTVEFSDDKKSITITPAITSVDSLEVWYDIG
jgi:RNA polymerase subunit RPABC4/transcription elongation factor Spt4